MIHFIKHGLAAILMVGLATYAQADSNNSQQPDFVDTETLPEAFKDNMQLIVSKFNNGDVDGLKKHFDFKTIGMRSGKGLFDKDRDLQGFVKGVVASKEDVLRSMSNQLETTNGHMLLLGYVNRPQGIMPQIRMDLGDSGVDYIEFLFNRNNDDNLQIIDWYQLSRGRMISQVMSIMAKMMIDPNPGILKKLLNISKVDKQTLKTIKAVGVAQRNGDYREANQLYIQLPENIRNTKIFIEMGIGIANFLQDDKLYRERLEVLAKNHGDDPSAAFLLIDHYFYQADVGKALENIEVMEKKVGRDGFTTYLKANLYYNVAQDVEKASAFYRQAISIEPNFEDAYSTLAYLYIMEKDYPNAVEVYQMLESQFGYQYVPDDFYDTPDNNLFKASIDFKNWMSSR